MCVRAEGIRGAQRGDAGPPEAYWKNIQDAKGGPIHDKRGTSRATNSRTTAHAYGPFPPDISTPVNHGFFFHPPPRWDPYSECVQVTVDVLFDRDLHDSTY